MEVIEVMEKMSLGSDDVESNYMFPTFKNVPREMIHHILSYLPRNHEICQHVYVSKSWHLGIVEYIRFGLVVGDLANAYDIPGNEYYEAVSIDSGLNHEFDLHYCNYSLSIRREPFRAVEAAPMGLQEEFLEEKVEDMSISLEKVEDMSISLGVYDDEFRAKSMPEQVKKISTIIGLEEEIERENGNLSKQVGTLYDHFLSTSSPSPFTAIGIEREKEGRIQTLMEIALEFGPFHARGEPCLPYLENDQEQGQEQEPARVELSEVLERLESGEAPPWADLLPLLWIARNRDEEIYKLDDSYSARRTFGKKISITVPYLDKGFKFYLDNQSYCSFDDDDDYWDDDQGY